MSLNRVNRITAIVFTTVAICSAPSFASDGNVLPAWFRPFGYSLDKMAKLLAYFDTSGNDPTLYPKTPFQVLYLSKTNTFHVSRGTPLFAPIIFITDSPPVLGTFPDRERDVLNYVYDDSELGAEYFEIVVDGKVMSLSEDYIAGPITAPNLKDGGGSHLIQVGAFLTPLGKGTHTVAIRAYLDGDAVEAAVGGPFVVDDAYTVVVDK